MVAAPTSRAPQSVLARPQPPPPPSPFGIPPSLVLARGSGLRGRGPVPRKPSPLGAAAHHVDHCSAVCFFSSNIWEKITHPPCTPRCKRCWGQRTRAGKGESIKTMKTLNTHAINQLDHFCPAGGGWVTRTHSHTRYRFAASSSRVGCCSCTTNRSLPPHFCSFRVALGNLPPPPVPGPPHLGLDLRLHRRGQEIMPVPLLDQGQRALLFCVGGRVSALLSSEPASVSSSSSSMSSSAEARTVLERHWCCCYCCLWLLLLLRQGKRRLGMHCLVLGRSPPPRPRAPSSPPRRLRPFSLPLPPPPLRRFWAEELVTLPLVRLGLEGVAGWRSLSLPLVGGLIERVERGEEVLGVVATEHIDKGQVIAYLPGKVMALKKPRHHHHHHHHHHHQGRHHSSALGTLGNQAAQPQIQIWEAHRYRHAPFLVGRGEKGARGWRQRWTKENDDRKENHCFFLERRNLIA